MVKPPKIRHSRSRKDPVTIELGPDEVSRVPDELRGDADPSKMVDEEAASASAGAHAEASAGETEPPVADITDMPETSAAEAERADTEPERAAFGREAEPESAALPHAPPPPRRGGASAIAAGLVGGLVVLGGVGVLGYAGILGGRGAGDDPLRAELAALRDQVAAIGPDQRIDGLASDLGALRNEVAGLSSGGDQQGLDAVGARLDDIEQRLAAVAAQGDGARVAELADAVRAQAEAAGALATRLDAVETQLGAMQSRVEDQAAQPNMALAVAASALKSAADRGSPFLSELQTYAAIAPDAGGTEALTPHAERGVPTRAAILAETSDTARAMVAAARPVDPDAGLLDRLMTSATSLVEVRPVGDVEGGAPGAVVARMEAAIRAEDYQAALAEYETLPEPAKAAGAELAAKIRSRQEVDALIGRLVAQALSAQGREG